MEVHELDKIPDEEIERLIECEYKKEKYQRKELAIDPSLQEKYLQAEADFMEVEKQAKELQKKRDDLREQLLLLFEQQGIKSWESPDKKLLVTYVAPIDRMSVDSAKLKSKFPQVYSECQKVSHTKAQLRVKVRGEEDGEW
jgi:predicted phage-related endonuclease